MSCIRTSPVLNKGFCEYCGAFLVQRHDEPRYNWIKRRTCNKSHAAFLQQKTLKQGKTVTPEIEIKSGVVRYERGTPEFERLAALYK